MSAAPRTAPGPLLCASIGNDHTTLGLVSDGSVVAHWRVASDARRTADEWAVLISGLLAGPLDGAEAAVGLRGVSVCATVPSVLREWREMLRTTYAGLPAVVVETGVRTGIPVRVDNPREVGTDRIVNALAAAHLHGGPVVVVDLGTATTFEVVNAAGEYVGGAIAPGVGISLDALGARGAQLRAVELRPPRTVIAKNTVEALQSGVLHGFASLVDGLVERIRVELGLAEMPVVATGGLAPLVLEMCATPARHEPWLTLLGLELVFDRNA